MPPRYEIRLAERPGDPPWDAFSDLKVVTGGPVVLVAGELDQSALHGVLQRVRALRLELLDVRRARSRPRSPD